MLRRLKTDVDFVIPPKREVIVYAQLTAVQQEMYRCILNKTIEQLVKAPSETPVCCWNVCHIALLAGALSAHRARSTVFNIVFVHYALCLKKTPTFDLL